MVVFLTDTQLALNASKTQAQVSTSTLNEQRRRSTATRKTGANAAASGGRFINISAFFLSDYEDCLHLVDGPTLRVTVALCSLASGDEDGPESSIIGPG